MNHNRYFHTFITSLLAILITSCGVRQQEKPIITVSLQPQKFFLEKIVGDKIEVKCLLANGGNPETYEPSLTHLLNLENSEAFFRIGNVGFESAIIDRVHNNNPDLKIYNNSDGINLLIGTHGSCNHHKHDGHSHADEADPHTWSSVKNAKIITANMYKAVVEIDPKNEKYYTQNYKTFSATLDSIDNEIAQLLADYNGNAFVVWHPSLSYFARDYGLEQISVGVEGKESSIQHMQQQLDDAKKHNAKVFFFQKNFDNRQASVITQQIGVEVIPINPLNYEWDKEILSIANAIASK